jgi:hypothetical protein
MKKGAPIQNSNAAKHGLTSQAPAYRVHVPATASPDELATLTRAIGETALLLAEEMANEGLANAALYAAVAAEAEQLAADIAGGQGIKASALGELSPAHYDHLIAKQTQALALILSQVKSAWEVLRGRIEILNQGDTRVALLDGGKPVVVLEYLAGHMRKALRVMKSVVANKMWWDSISATDENADLSARIQKEIRIEPVRTDPQTGAE